MLSPTAALTSFRKTPRSSSKIIRLPQIRAEATPATASRQTANQKAANLKAANRAGATRRESVSSVYFTAGGDFVADGRHSPRRPCRLHAAARLRAAGSRLSNYPSAYVLSGRQPDSDGHHGDRAARASVWRIAGPQPNDFHQFRWNVRHRAAIQSDAGHRRSRARSAVRDQRIAKFIAIHPPGAAPLP